MKIASPDADQYWLDIAAHTSTRDNGAPWPLQTQIAALIGTVKIEGSEASFDGDGAPSNWAVMIITADARLIRVQMQFDAEHYDLECDISTREPLAGTVRESWARRLSDVVRLDIGKVRMRPATMGRTKRDELDFANVSLTFGDGTVVDLDFDQVGMTMYDDRGRSDSFVDALRKHVGL